MGKIIQAGWACVVRETVLQHYKVEANAKRRCAAERENGVDCRVYALWISSALGDKE